MIPSKLNEYIPPYLPMIPEQDDIYDENLYKDVKTYFTKLPHHLSVEKIEFLFNVDNAIANKIFLKIRDEIK